MTLQNELQIRAAHIDSDDLLRLLGYRRPKEDHRQRLRHVLSDPLLGLRDSLFGLRYDSRAFVHALAQVLGIDEQFVTTEIRRIRAEIDELDHSFVPFIFVDTGFKRTTQPLFALAFCEHQRVLHLEPEEREKYALLTMPERVRCIGEKSECIISSVRANWVSGARSNAMCITMRQIPRSCYAPMAVLRKKCRRQRIRVPVSAPEADRSLCAMHQS